ncbi:hypothetical protein D3C85_1047650 [compost metagenome]
MRRRNRFLSRQNTVGNRPTQRFGGNDKTIGSQYALRHARPQVTAVAVGCQHHLIRRYLCAASGLQLPPGAMTLQRSHGALAMNPHTCGQRRTHQSACIRQRLNRPGSTIQPTAGKSFTAHTSRHCSRVQTLHWHATPGPLIRTGMQPGHAFVRVGNLHPSLSHRRAINLMPLDQIEHQVSRTRHNIDQRFSALSTVHLHQLIRIVFQRRVDLPTITARGPPARFVGFQDADTYTLLSQMQGRRQAGISCPHNRHIYLQRFNQRRRRYGCWRSRGPK